MNPAVAILLLAFALAATCMTPLPDAWTKKPPSADASVGGDLPLPEELPDGGLPEVELPDAGLPPARDGGSFPDVDGGTLPPVPLPPLPDGGTRPPPVPDGGTEPPPVGCHDGNWVRAAPMKVVRHDAAGVRLEDGRVLVTGGDDGVNTHASAELFDPLTGTWSDAAPMNEARTGHTAVLLADGRVLVAGGYGLTSRLASAELYDPAARTWTPTGPMGIARVDMTLTLLEDGRVLAVGGSDRPEVYEPISGSWSDVSWMGGIRTGHGAARLPDGRVLVVGRAPSSNPEARGPQVEIFDPVAGSWSDQPESPRTHAFPAVTPLVDGSVLVISDDTTEALRPSLRWELLPSLVEPRERTRAVTLADGSVLVAGGRRAGCAGADCIASSAERLSTGGRWEPVGALHGARTRSAGYVLVPLADGRALVAGGTYTAEAELFDPQFACPSD